jgi:hypothetical protein
MLGTISSRKNSGSHIDASLSRQPLVKGERLVRYEVNAVMLKLNQQERVSFVSACCLMIGRANLKRVLHT